MKRCTKCGVEKELSEFAKKGKYLQPVCKKCNRVRLKQHYAENSERYKSNNNQRRQMLKEWFSNYKSNLKCSTCSEDHIACLDFHHTNPQEKERHVSEMINCGYSIDKIKEEISKCIVLCANCHRKLHYGVTV